LLEKEVKKETGASSLTLGADQTVRLAISTFQTLLASDFRADEIEVAIVTDQAKFRVLNANEVDSHLVAISEAD
jgi:20S proteasome alpha/beta subunit